MYEDLKRTPEFELSLLDFVRLQCADICMPLQEETRQLRLLTEQQQHQLDEARHTVSAQTAGMEVQRRLGESSVEAFRMEARAASERCDRLSEKLKMSEDARTLSESLAGRCSIAEGERDQMRQEVSMLRERWEQQGRVLVALNESERALRSEMSDLAKHRDMLDLDKTYLTRELANVNMKYEAESRLVDAQKMHTSTAELKVQELTDRLLQFQLMQRSDLDTRLEVEVRQMKEQAQREMDDLRVTSREIIDRENKVLREAKGALEGQLTAARAELVAVSGKLDSAREQLFLIQSSKDNDIAMLRAEGKLSSYSLSATSANYEERCEQLRLVSLQLEHSREEVNALKTAVQQFEARHGQELLEVTAERDALKHRLAVYEAMETNIDKAVVMVAAGSDHRHSSGSEVHPALRDFLNLPTDPNRRLSQCIAAVGRALEVEKERDQLLIDLSRKSDEFRETQRRLAVADAALARVPHPHGYLVNKLRDLDDVISRQAVQLTACEEKVKALTVTVAETEEGKRLVAHRLEQLLRQRADVEGLRVLLERMQQCEEDDVYASSSESEEDEQPVDMPKAVSSAKRMSTEGKDSFNDSISSMRTRSRAPSEKLNKTWHSPVGSSLKGRADSFVSPTRSHTTSHHKPPAGMSAELFVQMTSPNPERSGGVDTLTSDFGSGHQSHFGSSPGIAVTPNSKSPAWHKRETLLH